jgi:N-acetylmuramoyl-L-alanine amidase
MLLVCDRRVRTIRGVPKYWRLVILSVAAWVLAGCSTGTSTSTRYVPLASSTPVPEPMPVAPAAPLEPVPLPARAAAPVAPQPPNLAPGSVRPEWPSNWVNAWIPLESWSQFNGIEKPRRLYGGAESTYQLLTRNGAMSIQMGSQTLRFGGVDFWLGFAPRLIQGLPYVHAVDARKTLQPLAGRMWTLPQSNRTVVIDAGHGGKDSGAKSCINGEYEKHYALDWARRLERLLQTKGWNVVMTRTNDTFLSLSERVAVAEQANAALFLSLHFNSGSGNGRLAGIETYCLAPTGMPSSLNRGYSDDVRECHPNNAFDDENLHLATVLHRSLLSAVGAADREVGRARFFGVLRGQNRPAVLIEGGYLTNPDEARKIATSAYRQQLAEGIAKALE